MRLKSISIRQDWMNDTTYKGEIEIEGEAGSLKFNLDNARSLKFLELALEEFRCQSDDFATNLLSDLKAVSCQTLLPTPASTEADL